jgi:hypothetical protein
MSGGRLWPHEAAREHAGEADARTPAVVRIGAAAGTVARNAGARKHSVGVVRKRGVAVVHIGAGKAVAGEPHTEAAIAAMPVARRGLQPERGAEAAIARQVVPSRAHCKAEVAEVRRAGHSARLRRLVLRNMGSPSLREEHRARIGGRSN